MKVIALTGRAGSGKDTATLLLQILTGTVNPYYGDIDEGILNIKGHVDRYKDYGFKFCREVDNWPILKFAYPVYQIAAILVGRDVDDIIDDPTFKTKEQAWGLTGRQLLQKIGSECFRDILGKNIWIDIMNGSLLSMRDAGTSGVIISDLRFLNEVHFLIDVWDARILKLTDRFDSRVTPGHQSETELESITPDFHVSNGSTFGVLMDQLAIVCDTMDILNCKYTWK